MRINILTAIALTAISMPSAAQTLADVLRSVEQNNVTLQALRRANEAESLQLAADNSIEGPSVNYSPFYRSGVNGVAASELVVSQGFDFPTTYAARGKANRLEREAMHRQWLTARRDILLQAKLLCIELAYQRRRLAVVNSRLADTDSLVHMVGKSLAEGRATAIELNKVRIERMRLATEAAQAEADKALAESSLQALNGGVAVDASAVDYPALPNEDLITMLTRAREGTADVAEAQARLDASTQRVKASGQAWLPKLEVGYRRNTDMEGALNGFLVGASFNLFDTGRRVKAAKAQRESDKLTLEEARLQANARAETLAERLSRLQASLKAYDPALMDNTLRLMRRAVEEGRMSLADYYAEADGIYEAMLNYQDLDRQRHETIANLTREEL